MRELLILVVHLFTTIAKMSRPGGVRAVAAESLLLKQQLIIINRARQRAPNLMTRDRFVLGLISFFVNPRRLAKTAVVLKQATLLRFHKALVKRKYRLLYSSAKKRRKPGPKGPSAEIIMAIGEMKARNPGFGYMRIAQQISYAFGIELDKDVVRRVLATHYGVDKPSSPAGRSWLMRFVHAKDSLWSIDLFRCESILLRSYWVMLIMDVFTRRIIGFGVERTEVDGISVCRMFNYATSTVPMPVRVSTDHDPLFRFHRWLANLRVLEIEEIKSVPYAPTSHPFVERLIGTIRREYLDHVLFWGTSDLVRKLEDYGTYFNSHRVHRALGGVTPAQKAGESTPTPAKLT
jgi:transposase InsO family protein